MYDYKKNIIIQNIVVYRLNKKLISFYIYSYTTEVQRSSSRSYADKHLIAKKKRIHERVHMHEMKSTHLP